jgi:fatty acid desaturase
MITRQHLFFYPLMFFARWNLYFQGVCGLVLGRRTLAAAAEGCALLFFYAWLGALVAAVGRGEAHFLGACAVRVAFLVLCNGVAGGLHVQIEHHLYPAVPRHNLEAIRPRVEALCKKHGLPYHSTTLAQGTWEVQSHLQEVVKDFPAA